MSTKTLSNEFMQNIATEEAWKELSCEFNWDEILLEKYQDKVNWNEISGNTEICWTIPMLQKFQKKINWEILSEQINAEALTESTIEAFKNQWNWHKLPCNWHLKITPQLLEKYADRWDWEQIIDHCSDELYEDRGIDFYEKYKDYIPASKLQNTRLWEDIVSQRKNQLIEIITS